MEFGLDKRAVLVLNRQKIVELEEFRIPDISVRTLGFNENYKYPGILETDSIKKTFLKENTNQGIFPKCLKVTVDKLHGANMVKAIDTRTPSFEIIRKKQALNDYNLFKGTENKEDYQKFAIKTHLNYG